ncbi:hypothetical protein [Paraburkholderia sp.]|nr:hypothetical protein [Paraburkholderia sp.]
MTTFAAMHCLNEYRDEYRDEFRDKYRNKRRNARLAITFTTQESR